MNLASTRGQRLHLAFLPALTLVALAGCGIFGSEEPPGPLGPGHVDSGAPGVDSQSSPDPQSGPRLVLLEVATQDDWIRPPLSADRNDYEFDLDGAGTSVLLECPRDQLIYLDGKAEDSSHRVLVGVRHQWYGLDHKMTIRVEDAAGKSRTYTLTLHMLKNTPTLEGIEARDGDNNDVALSPAWSVATKDYTVDATSDAMTLIVDAKGDVAYDSLIIDGEDKETTRIFVHRKRRAPGDTQTVKVQVKNLRGELSDTYNVTIRWP